MRSVDAQWLHSDIRYGCLQNAVQWKVQKSVVKQTPVAGGTLYFWSWGSRQKRLMLYTDIFIDHRCERYFNCTFYIYRSVFSGDILNQVCADSETSLIFLYGAIIRSTSEREEFLRVSLAFTVNYTSLKASFKLVRQKKKTDQASLNSPWGH